MNNGGGKKHWSRGFYFRDLAFFRHQRFPNFLPAQEEATARALTPNPNTPQSDYLVWELCLLELATTQNAQQNV